MINHKQAIIRAAFVFSMTALLACPGSDDDGNGSGSSRGRLEEDEPRGQGPGEPAADDSNVSHGDASVPRWERCAGGTYGLAPSGRDCNADHIERTQGDEGCYGPPLGVHCDSLVAYASAGTTEACEFGFTEVHDEQGTRTCVFMNGKEPWSGALDEAALNAACDMTNQNFEMRVFCVVGPTSACATDKIGFTQSTGCDNDGAVEFCVPKDDAALREALLGIHGGITFVPGAGSVGCDLTTHQRALYPVILGRGCVTESDMSNQAWADMCSIAALEGITKIEHYQEP